MSQIVYGSSCNVNARYLFYLKIWTETGWWHRRSI